MGWNFYLAPTLGVCIKHLSFPTLRRGASNCVFTVACTTRIIIDVPSVFFGNACVSGGRYAKYSCADDNLNSPRSFQAGQCSAFAVST